MSMRVGQKSENFDQSLTFIQHQDSEGQIKPSSY